ncbi:MAG TPA: FtsX-like permease family protein [Spirochaetia bacterium]|nr:FtsX-like permease family protein [Spirochaetia bacterium]
MIVFRIALRSLLRRRSRMILIALLVVFGTLLLVFGTTVTRSAAVTSRNSIIRNFTGDFIVYAARSREIPSPFAFNTPLPVVPDVQQVNEFLSAQPEVEATVAFAQNYSLLSVPNATGSVDVPFIFYAADPESYFRMFENVRIVEGQPLTSGPGILISRYQNDHYQKRYGVRLSVGDQVTALGLSGGGGVNALRVTVRGVFEPVHYANVFNYINFMDAASYSQLFNFTGVSGGLPARLEKALAAASESEEGIFDLAGSSVGSIDTTKLRAEAVSGYTMIAVRLKDHATMEAVRARLAAQGWPVKTARWDQASSFFANVASAVQAFIYFATALIFLVVTFIFMNTLVINIIERTGEIGTMRALGAERSFVRNVFLSETLLLNVAACLVGMIASLALVLAGRRTGIPLPETVSQYLVGGGPLPVVLSIGPFITALLVVVAASILATLLPIRVATRITPLAAMNDR